jgi:hypothetical protein
MADETEVKHTYEDYKEAFLTALVDDGMIEMTDIAHKLGVNRQNLYNWAKREDFVKELQIRRSGLKAFKDAQKQNALDAACREKNVAAIKFDKQLNDGWREGSDVNVAGKIEFTLSDYQKALKEAEAKALENTPKP